MIKNISQFERYGKDVKDFLLRGKIFLRLEEENIVSSRSISRSPT
jgi:hypothetical protein